MPSANEWLEFFYPLLFDNSSNSYALPSDIAMALSVGESWRPKCLPVDQQAQAQAHYAAYVLQYRRLANAAGMSASESAAAVVSGPIVERQEGTTRVKYRDTANGSAAAVAQQTTGPGTPYAAWQALWTVCAAAGSVDPVSGTVTRRGGIITRFGFLE